jgi:4-amino-4-deoxy-L-arabinose transferase-like glycosyltransferase
MIHNILAKRFNLPDPMLLGLLALATLLSCAYQRAAFPFWSDEAYTVLAVRARDWTELLTLNLRNEETPPLYFALLRLWALAWGDSSESTLRLFSAVCLAATVPLVGLLGARLWNRQVGLAGALLLAVNPFARYYGQEARAYTLAMLFIGIFMLGAYGYALQPGPRPWAAYILGGIAALYTHYFAAFVLAGVGAVVGLAFLLDALRTRTRASWAALGSWALAQALILLALSAWIPGISYQFMTRAQGPEERSGPLQFVVSLIALGSALPDGSSLALVLVLIVALALAIALTIIVVRGTLEQRLFILGAIALPVVCVVLMLQNESQFSARYIIFSLTGYVLLLAAGLLQPWRWQGLTRTLLVLLVGLSAAYALSISRDSRRRGGWDAMARTVEQQSHMTDAVFFAPPYTRASFEIQYHGQPLPMFGVDSFAQYYYERGRQLSLPIDADALQTQLGQGRRAWIVWDRTYVRDLPVLENVQSREYVFGSTTLVLVTPAEATVGLVCAQEASLCKK